MQLIRKHFFIIILFISILAGILVGYTFGERTSYLKPVADLFLNLLLTFLVPLVFFCIASSVANMYQHGKALKIIFLMLFTFVATSLIAAIFMLVILRLSPIFVDTSIQLASATNLPAINISESIVNIFTVDHFGKLFSPEHMLALVIFSGLTGLATALAHEKGKAFSQFLSSGADIFMRAVAIIMYFAPLGFFAFFAVLVGDFGSHFLARYVQVTTLYYISALIYFFIAFTGFAYLARKKTGVKLFWNNIFIPAMTAFATCSSAASIPANMQAAKRMEVPPQIYESVIPVGAILHKDGSVLGGVIKIAFLFSIFHMSFTGLPIMVSAILVGVLVGMVMGAIPSGGMIGELLIISIYGFPPQALMMIVAISILIDPIATMLNVTGDCVCSMLVTKLAKEKWLTQPEKTA